MAARKTPERGIGRPSRHGSLPTDPIPLRADPNARPPRPETADERAESSRAFREEFGFDIETLANAPACCDRCRAEWIASGITPDHV